MLQLLVLCALELAHAGSSDPEERASGPAWIRCAPGEIELDGEAPQRAENPIASALRKARPGTVIHLDPGEYPGFSIGLNSKAPANAKTAGGSEAAPIVVDGGGHAKVRCTQGDTIGIDQARPNRWITFRGLEIEAGDRAGVLFYRQAEGRAHVGYAFEDCHVLGSFDHARGVGEKSKWGVWGHSLSRFRFVGTSAPARIEDIRAEHAFYLQNPKGDVLIENVHAARIGRTFVQLTSRSEDGAPGRGTFIVRGCTVEDVCIAAGDGYKGGSAFSFAGRHQGTIVVERNRYRMGFTPAIARLTLEGVPHGTGALVAFQGENGFPSARLVLRENDFESAQGCGDRPLVSVGGCTEVFLQGKNRFAAGGSEPALALDPVDEAGRLLSPPNGRVTLAPATALVGAVTLRGVAATADELAHLRPSR